MILEGTPEFNRQHRLLNGAGLDPYLDKPIPSQQPLNVPREEEWEHLDGQEYHPAPHLVVDDHEGYDIDGNYHAMFKSIGEAITPQRWANYLQDAINHECSTYDYLVGRAERRDMAEALVKERIEAATTNLEKLQLEKAFELWRRDYGY